MPLLAKKKKNRVYNPYQLVGCAEEKSLTLKLSIKFLLVLTNATGGDRRVGVGFKRPMKIGWSDDQESVVSGPVLIGRKECGLAKASQLTISVAQLSKKQCKLNNCSNS